jgi:hypothetical protein
MKVLQATMGIVKFDAFLKNHAPVLSELTQI